LKANHNKVENFLIECNVVYEVKDTIFWKLITTSSGVTATFSCCLWSQRYNFLKANHNTVLNGLKQDVVVYEVKDTIFWKLITTINRI